MKAVLDMRGVRDEDDLALALRILPILDGIWIDDHYQNAERKKKAKKDKPKPPARTTY